MDRAVFMEYKQFKELNNFREISKDEIVFDVDNRDFGFEAINFIAINLYNSGYNFEIYYAEGQKSPHLHIKNIQGLEDLTPEQLKKYKELFLRKYCPVEYLPYLDFSLTAKHLIAEEHKPHFKYKNPKLLLNTWNEDKINYAEPELLSQTQQETQQDKPYNPDVKGTGITARITRAISIVEIARQFGLVVNNNKTLCPFHPDNNPSLVFYEQQGRFYCFACNVHGNVIKFYAMLKQLNPKFKFHRSSYEMQSNQRKKD